MEFLFIKMLMTCFTYTTFFSKLFHWMIQFCTETVIFFMLKESDTTLIKDAIAYFANVMGSLFYPPKEISFLDISGTSFLYILYRVFLVPPFLICHNWHSIFHIFLLFFILFHGLLFLVISPFNLLYLRCNLERIYPNDYLDNFIIPDT